MSCNSTLGAACILASWHHFVGLDTVGVHVSLVAQVLRRRRSGVSLVPRGVDDLIVQRDSRKDEGCFPETDSINVPERGPGMRLASTKLTP